MCAHTVRVALRKIDGVAAAEVSLNRGIAVVRFRPDNDATIEQIRDVVRSNGFTPKAADVRLRGRVVEDKGELLLSVPGRDQALRLVADSKTPGALSRVRQAADQDVLIEGRVPETPTRDARVTILHVRTLAVDPPR